MSLESHPRFKEGGKRPVSCWFHFGRKPMYEEKKGAIGIAQDITIAFKPFHVQHEIAFQCINPTLRTFTQSKVWRTDINQSNTLEKNSRPLQ